MSVAEMTDLHGVVPDEWRQKYQDIVLTEGKDGHDYLYGIDEEGHKNSRLPWGPLDQSIEETYGHKITEPYPALRAENEQLKLENQGLRADLDNLRTEMAAIETRLTRKITELQEKIEIEPPVFDPDRFKTVRQWKPQEGEKIPAPDNGDGSKRILTIQSINDRDATADVINPEGELVTLPLVQLAKYRQAEQQRREQETVANINSPGLRSRSKRVYNSLIGRHTETRPTVLLNEDDEAVVMEEEVVVDDRRNAAAAAIAVVALAGAGLIGYAIGHSGSGPEVKKVTITKIVPKPLPKNEIVIGKKQFKVLLQDKDALLKAQAQIAGLKDKVHSAKAEESSEGGGGSFSKETTASLNFRGDNPWNEVARHLRDKLGHTASGSQIRKATSYVLRINGLRWNGGGYGVDSHRLPVGFRFKIPNNIVEIANR